MGEERLTDEQLQQALGDGDIPAHFVDLLAAEVRDRRRAERDMLSGDASYREHRRYETASRVLAALLIDDPWMDEVGASQACGAVRRCPARRLRVR